MGRREVQEAVLAAVRAYCLQCSGGSRREVEGCSRKDCPLHPYRSCSAAQVLAGKAVPAQISGQMDISDYLH